MNNNEHATTADFRRVLWFSFAVLGVMLIITAYAWQQIPPGEQVPVHWNAAGEVDRYGSRFEGLMLTPLISLGMIGLFYVLPRIDPRREHLLQSARAYNIFWGAMMVTMLVIQSIIVLSVLGYGLNVGRYIPLAIGGLFMVIGNYMGKIRSNWFMGIRTPWTLTSELSWNKTHRLGGRMFMALGFLFVLMAFVPLSEAWVWLLIIGVFGMVIVMFAYSYVVWRNDPNARRLT